MVKIEGKCGISATVVCDSVSEAGVRLTTMLVDYPRIVHAEQLKHRMFSTSAASSRAIPVAKMSEQLRGVPVSFGKNQSGMQAGEADYDALIDGYHVAPDSDITYAHNAEEAWGEAKRQALFWSKAFAEAGYHKQIYNRITEPFQMMRVLITATEWDNFWWLRNDDMADPTLHEAARVMQKAYNESKPELLKDGEHHLPFVEWVRDTENGKQNFYIRNDDMRITELLSIEDAIKVSCARCAAQSFRNTDYGLEKSLQVYDRLVNGDKIHAGALEHCATPMKKAVYENDRWDFSVTDLNRSINLAFEPETWQEGISHVDRDGQLWSGNYRGFIQHRKCIAGENYTG